MNLFSKLSSVLLVITAMVVPYMQAYDKHDKVKYVQGGACEPGNGSKKHP